MLRLVTSVAALLAGLVVPLAAAAQDGAPPASDAPRVFLYATGGTISNRTGDRLTVEVDEHDAGIYPLAEFAAAIAEAGFAVHVYPVGLPILSEGEAYPLIVGVLSAEYRVPSTECRVRRTRY